MSRIVVAVALLATTAATVPGAAAQQESATRVAAQALELVRRANAAPEGDRPALLLSALQVIDAHPELATSTWLRSPLTAIPPDGQLAEARLSATVELLAAEQPPSNAASDRDRLDRILSSSRFHRFDMRSLIPGWLLPLVGGIEALLRLAGNIVRWPVDRLLEILGRALTYGPIVLALGLLIVVGIVALYARALHGTLVSQAELAASDAQLPPTAEEALGLAHQHAAAGRYREACHYLFFSTLLWLEEQGRFRLDAAATNQEHLAKVAEDPIVAANLRPFVLRFDRAWYGQDQVGSQDYTELTHLAGRLHEALA